MKPEDAIYKCLRDTCDHLIEKFRSCANDEAFISNGAAASKNARTAIRGSFLQAALFVEEFKAKAKVMVTTKNGGSP